LRQEIHTDIQLLLSLSEGDNRATMFIYNQYGPIIKKWIISNGGDEVQAQDVLQDSLVILYQKSRDPEFCLTAAIGTYLFAISKRLWYKKFKSKYYHFEKQTDFAEEQIEILDANAQNQENIAEFLKKEKDYLLLNKALDELGIPCSDVIKLFYIDKLSMAELAEKLNYANVETAKVQKYKCLSRLKKIFQKISIQD
jgi:RNA polymerase sigma factor (sigma-70 family)